MFDLDDRSWMTKSVIAPSAGAEITFALSPSFYPDPNVLDERDAIPLPLAAAAPGRFNLPSNEVLHTQQGLVEHYRSVLQLARQHGQSYNEFSHHMWLRLKFEWPDGAIGFAWYDTLDSMESLFDWLNAAADGEMWSDVEQGWEMIAVRSGPRLHFRQGGFDQGDEYANVALPREELLASISELRERMRGIVDRLIAEFGQDYWTRYRYDLTAD